MLVINLVRLMKSEISARNPMQILILKNLVAKLQKSNNRGYDDLDLTNYALLADVFGLVKETTAAKHCSFQLRLETGFNMNAIDLPANKFQGLPMNEVPSPTKRYKQQHCLNWVVLESFCGQLERGRNRYTSKGCH